MRKCVLPQSWQRRSRTDCANAQTDLDLYYPASILHKSIAGRSRPVSYPDGPIPARYRFIKNAYWVSAHMTARLYNTPTDCKGWCEVSQILSLFWTCSHRPRGPFSQAAAQMAYDGHLNLLWGKRSFFMYGKRNIFPKGLTIVQSHHPVHSHCLTVYITHCSAVLLEDSEGPAKTAAWPEFSH